MNLFQNVQASCQSLTHDRNGTGPFRLNGGIEPPAPAPETGSLPLYPPIAESTLGKVNIVIFSGTCFDFSTAKKLLTIQIDDKIII